MDDVNVAMYLAAMSNAVYADDVIARATQLSLGDVVVIRPDDSPFALRALVGVTAGECVVAFRGTTVPLPGDGLPAWRDLLGQLAGYVAGYVRVDDEQLRRAESIFDGECHAGFALMHELLWPGVAAAVGERVVGRRLWLTGHSLGGALAVLACRQLERSDISVAGVYTFGSPRVGTAAFGNNLITPIFRFEHRNDPVPFLPPGRQLAETISQLLSGLWGRPIELPQRQYQHVGQLCFLAGDGRLHREDDEPEMLLTRSWDFTAAVFRHGLGGIIDDHVMLAYHRALIHLGSIADSARYGEVRLLSVGRLTAAAAGLDKQVDQGLSIAELGRRGCGLPESYRVLAGLTRGTKAADAVWALGLMLAQQHRRSPSEHAPGLDAICALLSNQEAEDVARQASLSALLASRLATTHPARLAIAKAAADPNPQLAAAAANVEDSILTTGGAPEWEPWEAPLYTRVSDYDLFPTWEEHRLSDIQNVNATLARPPGWYELAAAVWECRDRGYGTVDTYSGLVHWISADCDAVTSGDRPRLAALKCLALWALFRLNSVQNYGTPTERLPGIRAVPDIVRRRTEPMIVRVTAVNAVVSLGRYDRAVRGILDQAAASSDAELATAGQQGLAGLRMRSLISR